MTEKTVTRAVRLPVEIAEFYGETPLRGVLESIYRLFMDKKVEFEDSEIRVLKTDDGVYTPECDMAELEGMAKASGMTLDVMVSNLLQMLTSGEIHCGKGYLYVDVCPFEYEKFIERCKDVGADPQDMIDKFTRMIQ